MLFIYTQTFQVLSQWKCLSLFPMSKVSRFFTKKVSPPSYLFGLVPFFKSKYFNERFSFCFVDVGIKNLGFVVFSVEHDWTKPCLDYLERVDLTQLPKHLTPHTSNEISDRVERFTEKYKEYLDSCTRLFIERQPIHGIQSVEQLLYNKYREKAYLIAPISVHAFFQYGSKQGYNYSKRKHATTKVADKVIATRGTDQVRKKWEEMRSRGEKLDDIGDPIVMAIYVICKKREEWLERFPSQ